MQVSKYLHRPFADWMHGVTPEEVCAVSDDEVDLWLLIIANIGPHVRFSLRADYVKNFYVRYKVARAKKEGHALYSRGLPYESIFSVMALLADLGKV
ncbi:hypothetical protein [Silvimonas soli]|uniref:hypothetical protein n=1 Tax=Silvimonas soli TaxID=2980100 RepID=UPI0024B362E6|nr:hypothetical protein [Silvimonas soli]